MTNAFYERIDAELADLDREGLRKPERILVGPQSARVRIAPEGREVLNLCANNYLGLANDPRVIAASVKAVGEWGAGLASVRFICGTQALHKELEAAIANFLNYEDAILFAAAFDANGGVFETLLSEQDAIVSDSLNHASLIDGIRLSKARRFRFATNDMADLERVLEDAKSQGAESILIATDGVFSMDGTIANLAAIVELAERFDAITLVDDCHATGFLGANGRGTPEYCGVEGRVDIVTGTFGKALGGAMGGFIVARRNVIDLLRQRARPYLFSNALAPAVAGASLQAIRIAQSDEGQKLRAQLSTNARHFRMLLETAGFELLPGEHPIIPIMFGDAKRAQAMAAALIEEGVLATAFSFPVVPRGQARIRTQMSAALLPSDVEQAAAIFASVDARLRSAA